MATTTAQINTWGNGLAVRLTKPIAAVAGVQEGTRVRIVAEPGRIIIEMQRRLTLAEMLKAYDPKKHGREGELMAFKPVGKEIVE